MLLLAGVGFTACDDDFDNTTVNYPASGIAYGVYESPYTAGNNEYSVVYTKDNTGKDMIYVKRIGKAETADSNTVYTVFVSDTVVYDDSVGMITATAESSFYADGYNGTKKTPATVYLAYQNDLKAYTLQLYSGSENKVATNVQAGATPHIEGMWTTPDEAEPFALYQLELGGVGVGILGDVNSDVINLFYDYSNGNATFYSDEAKTTAVATTAFNADYQLVTTINGKSVVTDPVVDESLVPVYNFTEDYTHTGDYTYKNLWSGTDAGLTLTCVSASDPTNAIFTISNWGYGVDFNFIWNMETNVISVPETFTGYTHSSYGDVYVADLGTYTGSSKYDAYNYYDKASATFHFMTIYYVSAGYFGYGDETFAITGEAASAIRKKMVSAKANYLAKNRAVKSVNEKSLILKKF